MERAQTIEQIRNRELCIRACIRFDKSEHEMLQSIMKEVSDNANVSGLSKRDNYFWYCKERNAWYGSELKPASYTIDKVRNTSLSKMLVL